MGNMVENVNKENVSEDAKKKRPFEAASECLSVDTESELLFPEPESTYVTNEATNGNSELDTDDLNLLDTLTRARMDRENQGPYEAEYSYGGEADLHKHYDNCDKNPGHKNFIPIDQFSIEDIPDGYRYDGIMDYIQAESDLTVRVTVRYVSNKRPATFPDSDKPYPGYVSRGQNRMTVGTGRVDNVFIYRDRQDETCKCKDCRMSTTPETRFVVIEITTANHVVFDDLEAEHTTCHLFFDRGSTPDTCCGVITLTGMEHKSSDIATDQYCMKYFTHDLDLGHRLRETCTRKDNLHFEFSKTQPPITQYKRSLDVADKQPLMLIVSHPHGCRKHISIGHWTSVSIPETRGFTFEYTTATCPGSSGATVVMPHHLSPESRNFDLRFAPGIHCGASGKRPGVNYFETFYYSVMQFWQSGLQATEPDFEPLMWLWIEGRSRRISRYSQNKEYERMRAEIGTDRMYPIL